MFWWFGCSFTCWLLDGYCLRVVTFGCYDGCGFGGWDCMLIVFGYIGLSFGLGVVLGGWVLFSCVDWLPLWLNLAL